MNQKTALIDKLISGVTALTIFVTPLLLLPITTDFYGWIKRVLLLGAGLLLLLLWVIRNIATKPRTKGRGSNSPEPGSGTGLRAWLSSFGQKENLKIYLSPLDLPLLALIAITFLSIFLNPTHIDGLMGQGMLLLGLFFIYFVISQTVRETLDGGWITWPLIVSAVVLTFISIFQLLNLLEKLPNIPDYIQTTGWTPAGNQFSQAALLLVALALSLTKLLRFVFVGGGEGRRSSEALAKGEKEPGSGTGLRARLWGIRASSLGGAIFCGLAIPVLLAGLTIFASNLITTSEPSPAYLRLPLGPAWQVATRTLGESAKTALLGVGPENFSTAFTMFKPIELGRTPLWNVTFTRSANTPLHLLTTTGVLGLLAWLWLLAETAKTLLPQSQALGKGLNPEDIGLAAVILAQLVLPPTILSWLTLFTLAGLVKQNRSEKLKELETSTAVTLVTVIILVLGLGYLTIRAHTAERLIYQSFQTINSGDGITAYNLQLEALKLNPKKANYHHTLSKTSFALAQTLAKGVNEDQENQEQIRNKVAPLLRQSINEAKITINLGSNNALAWQNLAEIYSKLGGTIDGAADWAINAYSGAIRLDPFNPELRVARGSIFYSAQNWEEAIINFRSSVEINPTFANGWYNLAAAYRQSEQPQKAVQALQQTLESLPEDAPDRAQVEKELREASPSSKLRKT